MNRSKAIYAIYLAFIVIIISEVVLRSLGYLPGMFQKFSNFKRVDSLVIYNNFVTDDYGIYKFSPWVSDSLFDNFEHLEKKITKKSVNDSINQWVDDLLEVGANYAELTCQEHRHWHWAKELFYDEDWNGEFSIMSKELETKKNTPWNALIKSYISRPFNSEGFRSIEFRANIEERIKVLILGDSFPYGMTAKPYFNSFPDILLSRGYLVYNTGIPGVDPAQYKAVVDKYVPLLKPDVVILNFCMNNDLMNFYRKPSKNQAHEHMTNAGMLNSTPLGKYLTPSEAYNYYCSLEEIPIESSSFINEFMSYSSILSLTWGVALNLNLVSHPILQNYEDAGKWEEERANITHTYLENVEQICVEQGAALLNTIIPDRCDDDHKRNGQFMPNDDALDIAFEGLNYHFPKGLTDKHFAGNNDYHFNNLGHLRYANFLDSLIQKSIGQP